MYKNIQTYINMGSAQIAIAGVPSVYKSQEVSKEYNGKRFIAAVLIAVSVGMFSLQTNFVLNASAEGNPISAPISTQESASPSATPTPTPSQNPVTAPEVTPTPTPSSEPNPGSSNPGPSNPGPSNNGGGGSPSAPSCNNAAPKAPYIVSAVTSGKNEIILNWTKPEGNVTHYSVAYGVQKGKPLYGAANVGNVTSFKVKGLSGGVTYYFTVKAVNDCTPSNASNEVAMKVGGKFISAPAQGFKPAVLGNNNGKVVKSSLNKNNSVSMVPVINFSNPVNEKPVNFGLISKVANFFKGWF